MTNDEEKELLKTVHENNRLLKVILHAIRTDEANDFITNVIANIVGNRIDGGNKE